MTDNFYESPTVECEAKIINPDASVRFVVNTFRFIGVCGMIFFGGIAILYAVMFVTSPERLPSHEYPYFVTSICFALLGFCMIITGRQMGRRVHGAKWSALFHSAALICVGGLIAVLCGPELLNFRNWKEPFVFACIFGVGLIVLLSGLACFVIALFRYTNAYCAVRPAESDDLPREK